MKQLLIFMGLISWLHAFLACSDPKDNRIIRSDSSGNLLTIDPNEVLMTIPTIENTFPEFENNTNTNNLQIIEDEWRQIEFITKDQRPLIDQEIDSITHVFDNEIHQGKDYLAFKNLHVRRLITKPTEISFEKIKAVFGGRANVMAGITINGNLGQVKNGFSLNSNGLHFYGVKDDHGMVVTFCFYGADSDKDLVNSIDKVSKFLATENLYLVNWINRKIVNEKNVRDFFVPNRK
jgi:hypothetical protein